jgi:putative protease
MQKIELLAPAKNLECGIAAIDHGADAVYIGAERFGARVAAGNSVEDIASLCRYAHVYGAKVYVTVNTIVYDDELEETQLLIERLKDAGVDALLVQDMGIVEWSAAHDENPIPLHASTQTDNRTAAKVRWLRDLGFRRVVLARELSVEEISAIHQAVPDVELEVFVHGALCVSYSGVCYASQYCFGRSANRGACAQFCRLRFDLQDADGQVLERGRYLLSLKDMCQIDALEQLMEAGAVSFKIEGRLKDVYYVKNVVAAYSQRLNDIIGHHPEKYCRASKGRCTYTFVPNLKKTFNRGFTHYFLNGRKANIASFDTPKALGEYVGKVKEIRGNSFIVAGTASFANGDGLCFFREEKRPGEKERRKESEKAGKRESERWGMNGKELVLEGFRVNKVVNNRLFPLNMPQHLRPGMALYRNNDQEFERLLSKPSSERKIEASMSLDTTAEGFALSMTALDGSLLASASTDFAHQQAQKPQTDNIRTQLSKLGGTPFECSEVTVSD